MINEEKWTNSLPKPNIKTEEKKDHTDDYRWISTIPKKKTFSVLGKYSLMTGLFICGLLFVSVIKNETRNLEKEINSLTAFNKEVKYSLEQATLDNEVITSPENISILAKEYLNSEFVYYKKSQIKRLVDPIEVVSKPNAENKNLQNKIKLTIAKNIKKKKKEIAKLQELYRNPKDIPNEFKTEVAKKIREKKLELKNIYNSPKGVVTIEKAQKWAAIQVAKLFFGIPVVPGK